MLNKMQVSKLFYRHKEALENYRIVISQGGSSSGKTYSILQLIIYLAANDDTPEGKIYSIVGESLPAMK